MIVVYPVDNGLVVRVVVVVLGLVVVVLGLVVVGSLVVVVTVLVVGSVVVLVEELIVVVGEVKLLVSVVVRLVVGVLDVLSDDVVGNTVDVLDDWVVSPRNVRSLLTPRAVIHCLTFFFLTHSCK